MNIRRAVRRRKTREIMKLSPDAPAEGSADAPDSGPPKPQGVIRFETGRLPSEFVGYQEKRESNLPGKVVMVIVTLALIFISIIAWLIASEPPK